MEDETLRGVLVYQTTLWQVLESTEKCLGYQFNLEILISVVPGVPKENG